MKDDLDVLIPLMKRKGVKLSKEDFHKELNTVFHDIEAQTYDLIHADMNSSLQEQFNLLAGDILTDIPRDRNTLKVLDVGCGTGLSMQKLLATNLSPLMSSILLLDTSSEMLKQCDQKAKSWNVNYSILEGDIFSLKKSKDFDVILICSVLHHIPNLTIFFDQINMILKKDGYLIHLQDPNGDYLNSPEYTARLQAIVDQSPSKKKSIRKLLSPYLRLVKRMLHIGNLDHIDKVNEELLKRNIVKSALKANEIWSVTDIHVEDLPFSTNRGISFNELTKILTGYTIVKRRSYGFFGKLKSDLPEQLKLVEDELIKSVDVSGRQLACVWKKN